MCNVMLSLDLPEGQSVAVEQVGADATATLGAGMVASIESSASFLTSLGRATPSARTLTGPFEGPVEYRGTVPEEKRVFSSCNRSQDLTLVLRLAIVNGTPSTAGSIALTRVAPLKLTLRPCKK